MNKERYDRLTAAGIQIEEALERFMDSEAMFERFLGKFLEDETYRQLKEALEKGDIETSIMKSHTLKGVTGNLSMKPLYQLTSRQVELLRAGQLEEARELMADIDRAYEETAGALKVNTWLDRTVQTEKEYAMEKSREGSEKLCCG